MAANLWLSSNQTLSRFKLPGACQVRAGWQVQSGISEQVTEAFYNTLLGKATWHCSSALPIPSILPVSFSLLISLLSQTKFTHSSLTVQSQLSPFRDRLTIKTSSSLLPDLNYPTHQRLVESHRLQQALVAVFQMVCMILYDHLLRIAWSSAQNGWSFGPWNCNCAQLAIYG